MKRLSMKSTNRWSMVDRLKAATLAVGLTGTLAATTVPTPASACGGFFCSALQPINQAAERIIFIQHEDLSVTGIIQIQYQGPSESFAWVLPVEGVPDVNVSSNVAFQRLQTNTNPNYTMNTTVEGECADDGFARGVGGVAAPSADNAEFAAGGDGDAQEPDVTVVGGGSVGPYDYEIISVNDELEDPAEVALEWLNENGYDVSDLGPEVLRPYLQNGLNLLAFRLQKDASAGSIRPVAIRFSASAGGASQAANGRPSIPIRPTAVAANDNMGVMVWNVGPSRSAPMNYRSLVINDSLLNWFNPGSNYINVINRAADESGGQGFVTELAAPSSRVQDVVWGPFDQANFEDLTEQNWSGREGELMSRLSSYTAWDGLADAFRQHEVLTAEIDADSLASCPSCWFGWNESIAGLDAAALLQDVEDNVIEPMRATQELLLERDYITRLYTTMSADEMTLDPIFDFDLPDLDNNHTAERIIECNLTVSQFEAPWRAHLPSGLVVRGEGNSWPIDDTDEALPANLQVTQDNPFGQPELITDNTPAVTDTLTERNGLFPKLVDAGCTCATPGEGLASTAAGFALVGMLGFAFRRRRR